MDASPGSRLATSLFQAFNAMVDEVVRELAERGHPGVTATLEFALVAISEGASDASALGRDLGVSKQAAAKTITALEALGYVHREPDPDDGRKKRLAVTERGREMSATGAAIFDGLRDRWAQLVGAETAAETEAALRLLVQ